MLTVILYFVLPREMPECEATSMDAAWQCALKSITASSTKLLPWHLAYINLYAASERLDSFLSVLGLFLFLFLFC